MEKRLRFARLRERQSRSWPWGIVDEGGARARAHASTRSSHAIAMLNAVSAVRPLRCASARNACRTRAPPILYERAHDAYLALRRTVIGIDPSFRAATFQESSSPFSS